VRDTVLFVTGRAWLPAVVLSVGLVAGVAANAGRAATRGDCSGIKQCELFITVDGSGTVTGPSLDCPGDCTFSTPQPVGFWITATPAPGQYFHGWNGD
jgi:hypothetical protein